MLWITWLTQKRKWLPTLLFIPFLYLIGWLIVKIILLFNPILDTYQASLFGTLISLLLFFILLPDWIKYRWHKDNFFSAIGLSDIFNVRVSAYFLRGLACSFWLVILFVSVALYGSWASWSGEMHRVHILNALFLFFVVGLGEELIFRVWLLEELKIFFSSSLAVLLQALIFSFAHLRFYSFSTHGFMNLIGVFLLGILLAFIRIKDNSYLFGCIGFHGGLVSFWYLINSGLVQFSEGIPTWLFGLGQDFSNPISGLFSMFCLLGVFFFYKKRLLSL